MRIQILLILLLICGCTEAKQDCLGVDQTEVISRYECLSNNAFAALTVSGDFVDSEVARFNLYKLDNEIALSEQPPNYVLVITSVDIGEPAIVLGLMSTKLLVSKLNPSGYFELVDSSGTQQFKIEVKGVNDLKVNGNVY